ncbi:unnamed protein product [Closterium sp. NIES-54]
MLFTLSLAAFHAPPTSLPLFLPPIGPSAAFMPSTPSLPACFPPSALFSLPLTEQQQLEQRQTARQQEHRQAVRHQEGNDSTGGTGGGERTDGGCATVVPAQHCEPECALGAGRVQLARAMVNAHTADVLLSCLHSTASQNTKGILYAASAAATTAAVGACVATTTSSVGADAAAAAAAVCTCVRVQGLGANAVAADRGGGFRRAPPEPAAPCKDPFELTASVAQKLQDVESFASHVTSQPTFEAPQKYTPSAAQELQDVKLFVSRFTSQPNPPVALRDLAFHMEQIARVRK